MTELPFESLFTSAIEVGIATAGFSGIVAVLGQRAEGEWDVVDLVRTSILLQSSFAAILLSFLALLLHGAGVAEPTIWRVGSSCYAVHTLFALARRYVQARRAEADPTFSYAVFYVVTALLIPFTALQIANVTTLARGWIFAAAVVEELVMAFFIFLRLIQNLWEHSGD
jgi:hypothetical protein